MANLSIDRTFKALADPTRRRIFERLAGGSRPVGELTKGLRVSRPAVSQHLKVLKRAGLVRVEPRGTRRQYSMEPAGLAAMRSYLDRFWDQGLMAFKNFVENMEDKQA
jgi:DNA-binding transcriptional ArsR family regulator